jgi:putative hydrolase of the HAD superfamily
MGHVFIDFDWSQVRNRFARRAGLPVEQMQPVFKQLSQLGYESGRIGTPEFLAELNRLLKTDIELPEFTEMWTHTFSENAEMAELMQQLKKQAPLYLLSNTNEVHYEWIQERFNVRRHFAYEILSYKVGSAKPDEPIYRHVFTQSGFAPELTFMTDDLADNIKTARKLGMKTHRFHGVQPLIKAIRRHGFDV